MNIIEVQNISKKFASHQALDNLSLEIPSQSIFGLLGPNGAGKTSLIRILTQILHADAGKVLFNGSTLQSFHTELIGYLPEERGLYQKMKVHEQLIYLGKLRGLSSSVAKSKTAMWLNKLELSEWKDIELRSLSKGMQQKVQFIAAVLHDPELIILDEPFSGFDPVNSGLITEEILLLKEQGKTIIFSTHRMETVDALCDQFALINRGKCILSGGVKEVKQRFKKNIFKIYGVGNIPSSNKLYNILFQKQEEGETLLHVQLHHPYSSNELISLLLPNFKIQTFNEVLPSMHEIFISEVHRHAAENSYA